VYSNLFKGQWNKLAIATLVLLAFSFVFGGASRDHALRLALVELAALPLLALALVEVVKSGAWREHRFALAILAALAALPLVQLAPLPPAIWQNLPGRDDASLALSLAGISPQWAPLSLTPDKTWRSFLALLPPIAMFLGVLTLGRSLRTNMLYLYLAAAAASLLLGVLQLSLGDHRIYPWATTTPGSVVGFFANRNHLADLLLTTLPFTAVFAGAVIGHRGRAHTLAWVASLFVGLVIIALAAGKSRFGIALAGPVLLASLFLGWLVSGRGRPGPRLLGMAGVGVLAAAAIGILAIGPIMDRFDSAPITEGRFENWPIVFEIAQTYLPWGSGLGSFDAVFRSVEPLARLDSTFFNQAHNEYLETWLETGWLGIGLAIAYIVWWARRSWDVWRQPGSQDVGFRRAASIAILIVLLHSAVDYPLRTETMAVLFAFFSALLEGRPNAPERLRVRSGAA